MTKTTASLALLLVSSLAGVAAAQPGAAPATNDCVAPCTIAPSPSPYAEPAPAAPRPLVGYAEPGRETTVSTGTEPVDGDGMWGAPAGRRFQHGFRLGWTYVQNYDKMGTRENGGSLKDEFGLKSPNMMLLGYEGFYRIVGHSWLNVLMVGNVTVAGLEQSKFIPAASGLIGFEFDRSFQLGVGVNLTPDPEAVSHMIAAAGWTPQVGKISVPLHFFYVPDTEGNNRMGATVGMTW